MKSITVYKEEIAALMKTAGDMQAKATLENRDLRPDEVTIHNNILDRAVELNTIVETLEREEGIRAKLSATPQALTVPQGAKIVIGEDRATKDKFATLGQQLSAVIKAGQPGGGVDPRLFTAAATGLNETVPSEGGFLIQTDFAERMLDNLYDNGLIVSQVERIPISGNSNGIKVNGFDETSRASNTYGGIVIYHADEAAEKTASKPKFRQVEMSLHKLIGLCYLTDELMMDAPALEGRVSNAFRGAFDFQIQDDLINGTGAGMALGVLASGCLVSVDKETGQKAATIVAENIIKMYSRRFASQTGNYAWYYNQNIEPQLMTMSIAVGTGGIPVYMPAGGLSGKPYGTIFGLPAYAIEQCATLGTVGDIIFGNFKDGYIMAEKGGLQQNMSIHVRFVYDESVLRFVLRMDGQPWRASALTPYKGGANATQSHFIALASRA
jgi:HK97 family phage major capsid protein